VKRGLPFLLSIVAAAAQANHPLITEDAEVVDRGRWELELHGERGRAREAGVTVRATELEAAIAYGVAKDLEVKIELPYARATIDEGTSREVVKGRGDLEIDLKWNFLERDGLELTLMPFTTLPTGRDDAGLGAGRARFGLDFIAAREWGDFEIIGNAGYLHNRNRAGERTSLRRVSGAFLWAATERLKLFVDVSGETNPEPAGAAMREWVYGFMYDLSSAIDFGLGIRNGLSDSADDRAVMAGMRLRW
jgi:hypothetical protein